MALKSLKITEQAVAPISSDSMSEYGYCTSISLEDQQVEALGLSTLPEPGTIVKIEALAIVKYTGLDKDEGGERKRLCLQFTDMSVDPAEKDKAKILYGE